MAPLRPSVLPMEKMSLPAPPERFSKLTKLVVTPVTPLTTPRLFVAPVTEKLSSPVEPTIVSFSVEPVTISTLRNVSRLIETETTLPAKLTVSESAPPSSPAGTLAAPENVKVSSPASPLSEPDTAALLETEKTSLLTPPDRLRDVKSATLNASTPALPIADPMPENARVFPRSAFSA